MVKHITSPLTPLCLIAHYILLCVSGCLCINMTYCCRGFKEAEIHVWKEMGCSPSQVERCETRQNYFSYQECTVVNRKMEGRKADWSCCSSDTSYFQKAKNYFEVHFCKCSLSCASSFHPLYSCPQSSSLSSEPAGHYPRYLPVLFAGSLLPSHLSAH